MNVNAPINLPPMPKPEDFGLGSEWTPFHKLAYREALAAWERVCQGVITRMEQTR